MKVILRKDVKALGETGDVLEVADGYARNYLVPFNLADLATEGAVKDRDRNIARIKAKAEKLHQQALGQAGKIKALGQIEISAKAGETGKLFGAVTTRKIAEVIQEKSGIEVDRRNIHLSNPINHVGTFDMALKLTPKVEVSIPVVVTASEVIAEAV